MVHIRRMENGDVAGMHRVHTDAVRQVCAKTVTPPVVEAWLHGRTPDGYLRAESEDDERFWVAVEPPMGVVGFASWRADELVSLYIDPDFHGQGIGRALFIACEDDAAANGQRIVRLISTLNAQGYYEMLGFRYVEDGYREKRGERIPHVEMVRDKPVS